MKGRTRFAFADVRRIVAEAAEVIEFHTEGMRQDGEDIPQPSSSAEYIEVAA